MINLGKLYLVSTPIGNYADMTIRSLGVLRESDYIVCEEYKEGSRLLRFFDINKELILLNEHNEKETAEEVCDDLINGKTVALISDCGAPVFADPGQSLLQKCREFNIDVEFLPGANSLSAAIVLSGFDISRFYYYGFLSPKSDIRKRELKNLTDLGRVFALLDAPYRLSALMKDLEVFFPERNVFVGFNLTQDSEKYFRGKPAEILEEIGDEKLKGEFVIIVDKSENI